MISFSLKSDNFQPWVDMWDGQSLPVLHKEFSLKRGMTLASFDPKEIAKAAKRSKRNLERDKDQNLLEPVVSGADGMEVSVDLTTMVELGEGAFGKVYKAPMEKANGEIVNIAVKIISLEKVNMATIRKEATLWKMFRHPNIVRYFGGSRLGNSCYLCMEYGSEGDLFSYIFEHNGMPENQAKDWFRQIVSAIDYMHEEEYAHRDIKAENVILFRGDNNNMVLKVTDFGLVKKYNSENQSYPFFMAYGAPEITTGVQYDLFKADIWALGVLLYAMLMGGYPYDEDDSPQAIEIAQIKHEFLSTMRKTFSKECVDTVDTMLSYAPQYRPWLYEVLENPWLKKTTGA